MPTLALTTRSAERYRERLERLPRVSVVERYDVGSSQDEGLVADAVDGAWAVVAGSERYGAGVFSAVRDLRAIVRWGIGADAIDLAAATAAGVAVLVTPGANAEAVADLALALMLGCIRRLPALDAAVRDGSWRSTEPSGDLATATVGIVGLGAIGRAVVARLRGFGCRLLAVEPLPDPAFCAAHDVTLTTLRELLARVDVLTLHVPLTEATRHLIGAPELALLPRHAVVVNTSRGELIDQGALVDALREGRIGGAGLDVFEREPLPREDPLMGLRNVILTPHVGSYTRLGIERTGAAVLRHVEQLLRGRLPSDCLNPEAWNGAEP